MEKDHLVLALTYDSLADLYVKQELFDEAKKHYKKTRKIIMRRFPGEHEDHPLWAGLIQDSAVVLEKRGKYEEAAEGFVKARELFKLKFGPKHVNYGTVTSNLARVYGRLGRLEEAETLYLEAIEIAEESGDRSKVAYRNQALGKIYQKQGRLEDACRRLERARDIYIEIKKLGEKDPKTLAVEKLLAELESKPTP